MDAIARLIKDPAWWFTAVCVGILASLVAGYLRDGISAAIARVSTAVRVRREISSFRDQKHVQLLAANPSLLVIEMVRFALFLFGLFAVFLFQVLIIILGVLDAKEPIVLRIILTWGIGIIIPCISFMVGRQWDIVGKAYREYVRHCERAERAESSSHE